jgi:hypothetical protein
MHVCALRNDKVGLPTRPDNRVRFDPAQTTKRRMKHWYKNSGVLVSVHRRLKESINCRRPSAGRRGLRLTSTYLIGIQSGNTSSRLFEIKPIGRSVKRRVRQFPPLVVAFRLDSQEWHGVLCGQLYPPKFTGWDGKSCH